MNNLIIARWFFQFLPPILAQTVRSKIITVEEGRIKEREFKKKHLLEVY